MKTVNIPTDQIIPSPLNANEMDGVMRGRLRESIKRYGLVVPLVVRPLFGGGYETIGGAQRLAVLRELGITNVPCVVVDANDAEARLLSLALNNIAGRDNLGLKGENLRRILEDIPQQEVLALLPESAASLQTLAALGQESIAQAFQKWEQIKRARLRHLSFQLTDGQLAVVEKVLEQLLPLANIEQGNPNRRGAALYLLCAAHLERTNHAGETLNLEARP